MDIKELGTLTENDELEAPVYILKRDGTPLTAKDGTPAVIYVLGSESKVYRREKDAITRSLLHSRKTKMEPADIERNRIRQAGAVVRRWVGFEDGGEPALCNPANVAAVLKHEWILDQVEQGIAAHADFFANSSANSSSTSAGTPSLAA